MSDGSKAIGSLAKKQSEVTRQGAQKLKFVPTLPVRRKKEETKTESAPSSLKTEDGRGRGRGRGMPRQLAEMTASGPFAMGPALSGKLTGRSMSRSDAVPPTSASISRNTPTRTTTPSLKKMDVDLASRKADQDEELYSEPDDGVEIIDLRNVQELDWMAPETLRKELRKKHIVKAEQIEGVQEVGSVNASEDEEEDLGENVHDFAQAIRDEDPSHREEKLLFFQFPAPFPMFLLGTGSLTSKAMSVPDIKPGSANFITPSTLSTESNGAYNAVDGVIGQLETYRNGAVKFRLNNGILFDVNAAIQPNFFQQAVYLHRKDKRIIVIGDVNKRFVVSPDVATLLTAMDEVDRAPGPSVDNEENLIKMDIP